MYMLDYYYYVYCIYIYTVYYYLFAVSKICLSDDMHKVRKQEKRLANYSRGPEITTKHLYVCIGNYMIIK